MAKIKVYTEPGTLLAYDFESTPFLTPMPAGIRLSIDTREITIVAELDVADLRKIAANTLQIIGTHKLLLTALRP